MAYSPELSAKLYSKLISMGFQEDLCTVISKTLCTEWTAKRMLGYLREVPNLRPEDVVDEMLAILEDRDRIIKKKEMEFYQGRINEMYEYGLGEEDECPED